MRVIHPYEQPPFSLSPVERLWPTPSPVNHTVGFVVYETVGMAIIGNIKSMSRVFFNPQP